MLRDRPIQISALEAAIPVQPCAPAGLRHGWMADGDLIFTLVRIAQFRLRRQATLLVASKEARYGKPPLARDFLHALR